MTRRGFPSTLGAMGAPDLVGMMKDPERTYFGEAPYGSMHPGERVNLLGPSTTPCGFATHCSTPECVVQAELVSWRPRQDSNLRHAV